MAGIGHDHPATNNVPHPVTDTQAWPSRKYNLPQAGPHESELTEAPLHHRVNRVHKPPVEPGTDPQQEEALVDAAGTDLARPPLQEKRPKFVA